MRLRFLNFVFFVSFLPFSAEAVEDAYTEKKEAIVRSLQKLQETRPELKEPLAGLDYLEQGLRIQTHFSGETAHEVYSLPLPDKILKSMNHALRIYKQEQTLESQEVAQAKSQTFFKLKRQPVFRSASSNTETESMTRSKSPPSKRSEEPAGLISRNKSFGLHNVQEKFSPSNADPLSFEITHLGFEKEREKSPLASPKTSPSSKRLEAQKERFSLMQKILDLRDKKRKEREKRKSINPLPSLIDFPDLMQAPEENEHSLKAKESPFPKRSEAPKRMLAFRQLSAGPKEEKKRSVNLEIQPLASELVDLTQKEGKQGGSFILSQKKSPLPKRSETPKRAFASRQPSLEPKEEKKRSINLEIQPLASELVDLTQKEGKEEGSFILSQKKSPLPKRSETPKRTIASRQPSAGPKEEKKRSINLEIQPLAFEPIDRTQKERKQGGSFLLGMKAKKTPKTLQEFFDDYFQTAAEKKFESAQSVFYFENSDSREEFEKAVNQMLFAEVYKPLLLPVAGEESLSPLIFTLGTLNQIFFARFSDQPVYARGEKVNPVVQSRFDCFYTWELIEQLNSFQQSESKKVSFFSGVSTPLEEMKQNMKPVFDLSLEIQQAILDLAETAPPETLEKIGTALYIAFYDSFPYVLSLEEFKKPHELIGYLERLAEHYLATSYLFNPESVRDRFEFQGMRQRHAVVEALNHTAKRFKKPPFDHDLGRFETIGFLEHYVSDLRQEAETWVASGFKSLAQAFK
ncbi:MAG: hypothetical protein ACRCUQ_02345 [Alphaproteobacteria bacterium]